jgi:hypothetical protein
VVVEELDQGEDVESAGLGATAWIGIALVCVVAGILLMSGRGGSTTAAQPAVTTPVQTFTAVPLFPAPSVQPVPEDPRLALAIGFVCAASTDGRTSLTVSFEVVNISSNDVTVLTVNPLLPLNGLRPVGKATAGGNCARPGSDPVGGLLPAGEQRLFTMRFRLPKECPQPLPVQASVNLRVGQMVGTTTVPIFADLGAVKFDSCPSTN